MSAEEYATWQALDQIQPVTDLIGRDWQRSYLLALSTNVNLKKGAKRAKVEDFMLRKPRKFGPKDDPQTLAEKIKAVFMPLVERSKAMKTKQQPKAAKKGGKA